MIGSGFPAEFFYYGGFLPVKSGGRERDLLAAAAREETSVFFESPHKIAKTLAASGLLILLTLYPRLATAFLPLCAPGFVVPGMVISPLFGRFDYDLYGHVYYLYALAVLFVVFLVMFAISLITGRRTTPL